MPLLHVVLILVLVGFVWWLIKKYIPMDPSIKKIITAVIVVAVILWLLGLFGVLDLGSIHVGR